MEGPCGFVVGWGRAGQQAQAKKAGKARQAAARLVRQSNTAEAGGPGEFWQNLPLGWEMRLKFFFSFGVQSEPVLGHGF